MKIRLILRILIMKKKMKTIKTMLMRKYKFIKKKLKKIMKKRKFQLKKSTQTMMKKNREIYLKEKNKPRTLLT